MEKKKEFIINALYFIIIFALVYFGVNYVLGLVFPFILAFFFAYFAVRLSNKIFSDTKTIHRILTLVLLYLLIVLLIVILVSTGISKLGDFIKTLPNFYKNTLEPYIGSLETAIVNLGDNLPDSINQSLNNVTDGIFEGLKSLLSSLASGLVNITTSIITHAPEALVSIIVTVVSSFYMISDYENISNWFISSIPEKGHKLFYEIKDFFENVLIKIAGSYISIMFVTFIELLIGLSIIGIPNSPMWAIIIAMLDILPVLGVGTILIPWSISSIITGRFVLGLEILALYLIITVIRNVIEPKLVGTNLGLHPLATLISMIIGIRLFGAVGMFGLPLTLSFFSARSKKAQIS